MEPDRELEGRKASLGYDRSVDWLVPPVGLSLITGVFFSPLSAPTHFVFFLFFFFLSFVFIGPLPWYVEVPRLGVKSEL